MWSGVTQQASAAAAAGGRGYGRGGIGRRVAARREQLGLTREDVAVRAGTAPGYLRYLEEQPAVPGVGFLVRLAGALETTVSDLCGGVEGLPDSLGQWPYHSARHPELAELDPEECRARLSSHGVGRIAVSTPQGPAIVPVGYAVVDDAIVFGTEPGAPPAAAAGTEAAFEVDHIDEALGEGWSVLVVGPAREVTDPEEARRLAEHARTGPWGAGEGGLWMRIDPAHITGRRIGAG